MSQENNNEIETNKLTIEETLIQLITNIIKNYEEKLSREELKQIVNELLPDINLVVSSVVKEHFIQIANFIIEEFGEH